MSIRVLVDAQRRFMHEAAGCVMQHQHSEKFLPNQFLCFASQDDLAGADIGLQFAQRGLDLPTLMIERRQFLGARQGGIENGG